MQSAEKKEEKREQERICSGFGGRREREKSCEYINLKNKSSK